jgi:lycopene cyclase domain-containing protein
VSSKFLYLSINILSVIFPLIFSFYKHFKFIKYFSKLISSFLIVGAFYIIWDIYFTQTAVWGFNTTYCIGLNFCGMPLEEYLFFICIPYASIFLHYVITTYKKDWKLPASLSYQLAVGFITLGLVIAFINYSKAYTFFNFIVFAISIFLALRFNRECLQKYFISYLIILLPFIIVNGILTGSFIDNPIVWYNNNENLGLRFFTIPVEDFAYAFSLLLLNLLVFEYFTKKIKLVYE